MQAATTYTEVLGRLIENLRKNKGMTQLEAGQKLELSQSAYSRLERGQTPITMPQVRKLAELLGVTPTGLITHADRAANELRKRGVQVLDDKPKDGDNTWLWVAGTVLAGIIALVLVGEGGGSS